MELGDGGDNDLFTFLVSSLETCVWLVHIQVSMASDFLLLNFFSMQDCKLKIKWKHKTSFVEIQDWHDWKYQFRKKILHVHASTAWSPRSRVLEIYFFLFNPFDTPTIVNLYNSEADPEFRKRGGQIGGPKPKFSENPRQF